MTDPDAPSLPRIRKAAKAVVRRSYRYGLWYVTTRLELPEVLNRRGLLGTGVEVGVCRGEFSECLLEGWHGERLISVDAWSEAVEPDDAPGASAAEHDERYRHSVRRLSSFGTRSTIWKTTSAAAASRIKAGSLDFVYIDAWHGYEAVREDLGLWHTKVRAGGLLCGHDFLDGTLHDQPYGVRRAVTEFCEENRLAVAVTRRDAPTPSWMIKIPGSQPA